MTDIADHPPITNVRLIPAPPGQGNLVGFVRCDVGGVVTLDLVLVKTANGLTIAYPKRRDRAGRRHSIVRAVNERARQALEESILAVLMNEAPIRQPNSGVDHA